MKKVWSMFALLIGCCWCSVASAQTVSLVVVGDLSKVRDSVQALPQVKALPEG